MEGVLTEVENMMFTKLSKKSTTIRFLLPYSVKLSLGRKMQLSLIKKSSKIMMIDFGTELKIIVL